MMIIFFIKKLIFLFVSDTDTFIKIVNRGSGPSFNFPPHPAHLRVFPLIAINSKGVVVFPHILLVLVFESAFSFLNHLYLRLMILPLVFGLILPLHLVSLQQVLKIIYQEVQVKWLIPAAYSYYVFIHVVSHFFCQLSD